MYEEDQQVYFKLDELVYYGDDEGKEFACLVPWEEFGISMEQTPQQVIDNLRKVDFNKIADYIKLNVEGDDY